MCISKGSFKPTRLMFRIDTPAVIKKKKKELALLQESKDMVVPGMRVRKAIRAGSSGRVVGVVGK